MGLKSCNREKKGKNESTVEALEKEMQLMDCSEGNFQKKAEIFERLQHVYHMKTLQLKQKSRIRWDLKGDSNSRFFHKAIQQRIRRNQINKLRWRNKFLTTPTDVKKGLLNEFKEFYSNKGGPTPFSLNSLEWMTVSNKDADFMIREFTREEI